MKLLFAIVNDDDARAIMCGLNEKEISVTKISSTGGFLRGGNSTLMVGVDQDKLDSAIETIKTKARKKIVSVPYAAGPVESAVQPVEITVGGATIFVVDVENFLKI